jgi:predicted molibdopterin-dependent oxidoreductase YjgC
MIGNVYQTICSGCNMGCGLYIREDEEGALAVDFMKSSPVNLGKLCRFGMNLQNHYKKATSTVDDKEVSVEDAVSAASDKLKGADVTMLGVGNTTNEESLAFNKIADTLGTVVNTGMGVYSELPTECHPTVGVGITLDDIESAKRIALFVDPYVQYPLLVRRILAAKKNGASVVSVGWSDLHLADENKFIDPDKYESELGLDEESVIIADVHPNSDSGWIKRMLNLALKTQAKILFMKPFVNATGVDLLCKGTGQKGISEILSGINEGSIKTLVTLDSDPIELMPDSDAAAAALSQLDNLIVISSRDGPVNKMADVVIATEPLYAKTGSFMNVEGLLLNNSGESTTTTGIDALSALNENLGGEAMDYQNLHNMVLENIVQKFTKPKYKELACEVLDIGPMEEKKGNLIYLYNPFMWFDQSDDNDFVMVNMNMVNQLGLGKGGMIALTSDKGTVNMRYRVEDMPDGLILTAKKLPVATEWTTVVSTEAV